MLTENLVICPAGESPEIAAIRLLWTTVKSNDICLINVFDLTALPEWHKKDKVLQAISSEHYFICDHDPVRWLLVQKDDLSVAQIKRRDKRLDVIDSLFQSGPLPLLHRKTRGQLLRGVAEEKEVTSRQLIKWLRRYWQYGQCREAMTPIFDRCGTLGENEFRSPGADKRGRPREGIRGDYPIKGEHAGINVDETVRRHIKEAVQKHMKGPRGFAHAYDKMINDHYGGNGEDGLPRLDIPSLEQFTYHARKLIDRPQALLKYIGATQFGLNHRSLSKKAPKIFFGPGATYQADATLLDVVLRSEHNPELIVGKPNVYIVLDVYSHLWVGFYVGFEEPSWVAAMLAFECAFTPKVEYFARFGVTITEDQHPVHTKCQSLTVDKGPEFMSKHANAMADRLEIGLARTPTRRADIKGLVESHFRTLKRHEENEPGFTGDRDPRDPPKKISGDLLTLKEFTRRLINFMNRYNSTHPITDLPPGYAEIHDRYPVPLDLWKWGTENIGRPAMPPPYLRSNLLYKGSATASPDGLRFQKRFYTAPEVESLEVRGTGVKNDKYDIRYDPRDVAKILILGERGDPPIECSLTPACEHLAGLTERECDKIRGEEGVKARKSKRNRQAAQGQTELLNQEDIARRPEKLPPIRRSNTNQSAADRDARKTEHREKQSQDAWTTEANLTAPGQGAQVAASTVREGFEELDNYDTNFVARLGARRDAKKPEGAK